MGRIGNAISASLNRRPEDVGVEAVVVAELKFRDVERQVLAADLVEAAHDAALQERPEAVNALRVHDAINVLLLGVLDEGMVERLAKVTIAGVLISGNERDLIADCFVDELIQGLSVCGSR